MGETVVPFRHVRRVSAEIPEILIGRSERLDRLARGAAGDGRVQLRLPLTDLAAAERDLTLLRDAVERSLKIVQTAQKRRDDMSALARVRGLLGACNRMLNAKRHGP